MVFGSSRDIIVHSNSGGSGPQGLTHDVLTQLFCVPERGKYRGVPLTALKVQEMTLTSQVYMSRQNTCMVVKV